MVGRRDRLVEGPLFNGAQRKIDTGVSPREVVYREDKLALYRYQAAEGVEQNPVPTLIVYALVNRPYMTDIQEDRSTIKGLLAQLDDCHNPSHCPHGRPTWIHWDLRSLDKSFKRIV